MYAVKGKHIWHTRNEKPVYSGYDDFIKYPKAWGGINHNIATFLHKLRKNFVFV